jgi:hypothetical protein
MKTSRIITTVSSLSLVLFLSFASIANQLAVRNGEIEKTTVKNQVSAIECSLTKMVETEFNYLRFDVNKFNTESFSAELPAKSTDYLRFDVNNFISDNETMITEMPESDEFNYLHFDVTSYTNNNANDLTEMPACEFDYLRFDVNTFAKANTGEIDELPVM